MTKLQIKALQEAVAKLEEASSKLTGLMFGEFKPGAQVQADCKEAFHLVNKAKDWIESTTQGKD